MHHETAHSGRDFDLLVVMDDIGVREREFYRLAFYRGLEGAEVAAEPWVMGEEEFEETKEVIGGLAYPAWEEGVVLDESS